MSLSTRLRESSAGADVFTLVADPVVASLRQRVQHTLVEELGPLLYDRHIAADELTRQLKVHVKSILDRERAPLSAADREQLLQDVTDDVMGYGPIQGLLDDPDVTEVMVNGPKRIYVERSGKLTRSDAVFADEAHLRRII